MEKNKKKKFRDIRNAVVMMCVMVAMMSTASYAWFTMSDSPTVTGMTMTATTAGGGLEVSNTGNTAEYYSSIITSTTDEQKLKPVTPDTTNVGQFLKPVYQGNTVKSVTDIDNTVEYTEYVAKYTFWLRSKTSEDIDVGIVCGDASSSTALGLSGNANGGVPNLEGSMVRKSSTNSTSIDPAQAVRVGFKLIEVTTGGNVKDPESGANILGKMIIWEPNAEADTAEGTRAESTTLDATIKEDLAVRSQTDGLIMDLTTGDATDSYTSDALFTLSGDSVAVKIEMYVWLQGSDKQCADEIQAGDLEAQVQFTPVEDI